VNCFFEEKAGQLAIDQIRSVDKTRLIKKLGTLEEEVSMLLCRVLVETFKF
jgi:mRNA interferase MazF